MFCSFIYTFLYLQTVKRFFTSFFFTDLNTNSILVQILLFFLFNSFEWVWGSAYWHTKINTYMYLTCSAILW